MAPGEIEFALAVDWEDGSPVEIVPAQSAEHATTMATTIYQAHPSWTIGRTLTPWRYVNLGTATLSDTPLWVS